MDRTQATVRKLLAALPAPGYDLGILGARGIYRLEAVTHSRILRTLPYLKYRNDHGAHLYIRPTGEAPTRCWTISSRSRSPGSTLKATTPPLWSKQVPATSRHGFATPDCFPKSLAPLPRNPCRAIRRGWERRQLAEVRTPPRPHQPQAPVPRCWRPLPLGPSHRSLRPALRRSDSFPFPALRPAAADPTETETLCAPPQLPCRASRFVLPVTLARFRISPPYGGRPAAADMAFSIAAYAQGWSETDIAAALSLNYLSRDNNPARQAAYIRRTLAKARCWAA